MIYFLRKGKLPWDLPRPTEYNVDAKDPNAYQAQLLKEKAQKQWGIDVLAKKSSLSIEELCENCPNQFKQYMEYVRGLTFSQKPNYKQLRTLFDGLFRELNFEEDG